MFTQLRTRLLLSGIVIVSIVIGTVLFIYFERLYTNEDITRLLTLKNATRQSRELSLYAQYNAHDINAYTLGHTEHREEFVEHAASFAAITNQLQASISNNGYDTAKQEYLDRIAQIRSQYDIAATNILDAADANRTTPSAQNQAREDAAWEIADQLGDQLDGVSQELAAYIDDDASQLHILLMARNEQMVNSVIGVGVALTLIIAVLLGVTSRSIGKPLRDLLAGVQQLAAGDLYVQVDDRRNDEIGSLSKAFNVMATQIRQQNSDLQEQYQAANTARMASEAAQAELAAQLATIEEQRTVIREMSVPILPINDHMMVLPLIGSMDSERLRMIESLALQAIERGSTRYLIMDITGIPMLDTAVAQGLLQIVRATRLMGANVVLVGIRPEVAQSIVGLGISLDEVVTSNNLQSGIAYALSRN